MEFAEVSSRSIAALALGAALAVLVPVAVALIWKIKKKEPFKSILFGALSFILFALLLEKIIQNVLIFPVQMGLPEHAASRYINARPLLWAFLVALFPGVFEETGRLICFKTVLGKRKNRETSISYGIGHGGMEAILLLGITYITYISYALMINNGSFATLIEQAKAVAPDQVESLCVLAAQIASVSFADILLAVAERVFAVLFHIGASILVFYAYRDKKRFWLYPLAVLLHTATDFIGALYLNGLLKLTALTIECIGAVFGLAVFFGAYLMLYKKDSKQEENQE